MNKTKPKSKILIFFIIVIVLCTATFLIFFLSSLNNQNIENNPQTNEEKTPDNVINIGGSPEKDFQYITISEDDTVRAFDKEGSGVVLNLEKNSWSKVGWSQNKKYISVLSNLNNVGNLHIRQLENSSFDKVTDFTDSGIKNYFWFKDQVYFMQGLENNRWLHKYNPESKELLKIYKTNGELLTYSNDYLVLKDKTKVLLLNAIGEVVWEINNLKGTNGKNIEIANIFISSTTKKVIITSSDNKIYKMELGSNSVVQVFSSTKFIPLCRIDDNKLYALNTSTANKDASLYVIDTKTELSEKLGDPLLIEKQNVKCNPQMYYNSSTNDWFILENNLFKNIPFLNKSKEIAIANII